MALAAKNLANGQLSNTATTLYTVPAGKTTIVKSILLHNTDTTDQEIILYLLTTTGRVVFRKVLEPATTTIFEPDTAYVIEDSHTIEAQSTSASVVDYWISGAEESTPVSGLIPAHLVDGQLPDVLTTIYTAPAATVVYLTGMTFYNTDNVLIGQRVQVWLSDGTSRKILDVCLRSFEHMYIPLHVVLDTGDTIEVQCETTNVVDYWIDGIKEV